MSSVAYNRSNNQVSVFDKNGNLVASAEAGNNVTISSNGTWENGIYSFSHYNEHAESGVNDAYGSNGIFVFDTDGLDRTGMGIHSGRDGPQYVTEGCVRTEDGFINILKQLHFGTLDTPADRIRTIVVTGN